MHMQPVHIAAPPVHIAAPPVAHTRWHCSRPALHKAHCSLRHKWRVRSTDSATDAAQGQEHLAEVATSSGSVFIRRMQQQDVTGAGLLLTRCFAGTPEAVKLEEAVAFMQQVLDHPEQGTTLIARLVPTDPALLPPNQTSRLVGTTGLSYSTASREEFPSLNPPQQQPYLSNMAVDAKFRRQGIARALLAAADAAVAADGYSQVWLHVRLADDAAAALYQAGGYSEVARDAGGVGGALRGLLGGAAGASRARPRILMRKDLTQVT